MTQIPGNGANRSHRAHFAADALDALARGESMDDNTPGDGQDQPADSSADNEQLVLEPMSDTSAAPAVAPARVAGKRITAHNPQSTMQFWTYGIPAMAGMAGVMLFITTWAVLILCDVHFLTRNPAKLHGVAWCMMISLPLALFLLFGCLVGRHELARLRRMQQQMDGNSARG